jgi:hypothetical protein
LVQGTVRRLNQPNESIEITEENPKLEPNEAQADQWDAPELQTNWFEYWSQFFARWERP